MIFEIVPMSADHIEGVVALQRAAFPPPFDEELLWKPEHLARHLEIFPEGQWVATLGGIVAGSCSNTRITEEAWNAHASWEETVGGPLLNTFAPEGSTLFGLDISVHPDARRMGMGRALYNARYQFVRERQMARFGTACRLPDYQEWARWTNATPEAFAAAVNLGMAYDRTLSPLLAIGVRYLGVIENHMDDPESGNAAAILEWTH